MTWYGFRGPSGQFYPLADNPLEAQMMMEHQQITSRMEVVTTVVNVNDVWETV